MAHHLTARDGYRRLVNRLNACPQGAPPSEVLYRILALLFSEQEAKLVAQLPVHWFTPRQAASYWKVPEVEARQILDGLASRAILVDYEVDGAMHYVLPPPMAGFFEFSMMRVRGDLDQKLLAELYYQYINVEEDFIRSLFAGGETQLGRVLVHEPALAPEQFLEVLDWERSSQVISTASSIGISLCYCRHKMAHLGRACDAPLDICMTFGSVADSLIRHSFARKVDSTECLDLLGRAHELGLVQFGENVRQEVSFVCNCCGCCCEAMIAARRYGLLHPVQTTAFIAALEPGRCDGCGKCVAACPVEAISLVSAHDPKRGSRRKASFDARLCLGCGVCVRSCPTDSVRLQRREARLMTPLDTTHRVVVMAIERGTLAKLIFARQNAGHRALAAILGVILRLPPLQQALASEQVRSRYLEKLIATHKGAWSAQPAADAS